MIHFILFLLTLLVRRVFQVIEFSPAAITGFIAMVGILSIVAQVHEQVAPLSVHCGEV